jgi:hypothetical protein
MKYFSTLPFIISTDPNGNKIAAVNLLVRTSIVPGLLNTPSLYYEYDIQEGDTPEIIASKYYNDPYRYWLVLFANQLFDPQWDWPLPYQIFINYINDKYASVAANNNMNPIAYTQATNYEYRKIISTIDSLTQNTTTDIYVVDFATYTNTITSTETVAFQPTRWNSNAQVTVITSKAPLSIYDWEEEQNEKRRSIRLLNASYVNQIEEQFNYLVNK